MKEQGIMAHPSPTATDRVLVASLPEPAPQSPPSVTPALRENVATPEGRELGAHLARICDGEAERQGRDGRCATCAFRAGDHIANGSVETLMSALKCAMERTPFWCHEADEPCRGWLLMRSDSPTQMPWDHVEGTDHG